MAIGGFKFSKAEVLLVDLRQSGEFTDDMFAQVQPQTSERIMGVMDKINAKWGRGTLRPGGVPATPDWGMRRELNPFLLCSAEGDNSVVAETSTRAMPQMPK